MKKHLILLILLFSGIRAVTQKISQLITQDTITYVYKLDYAQSKYVLKNRTIQDTSFLFTRKFKEYARNKFKTDTLPNGNYIIANITDHQVNYTYTVITPFIMSTKVLKDEVFIFLFDKKNKALIKNAKIELDGKPLPYDPGCGGYSFFKKEFDQQRINRGNVFLKVSYDAEVYAFQFSLNNQPDAKPSPDYYNNTRAELNSPGYLILDKPLYRPLDTLNLKAFLVNFKNGKPLRQKVILSITEADSDFRFSKTIKRKTRGAYLYQWKIPDTLKIDRSYTVRLRYEKLGRRLVKQSSFRLSEYELAKNVFDVDIQSPNFFAGDDVVFYVTAKDMNGFPVQGAQVHCEIQLQQVMNLFQDSLSISPEKRNSWYQMDTLIEYENFAAYRIPSDIFPNVNGQYNLNVTITDPISFEKKSFSKTFTKQAQTEKVLFYQDADSLRLHVLYNGKDTMRNFMLITLRDKDTLSKKKVSSPYACQLDPTTTSTFIIDKDSNLKTVNIIYNKLEMLHVKGKRNGDSVQISFQYPFTEPVHYRIYKKDKLVKSGETSRLTYTIADQSLDQYRLLITSHLQSGIENNFYEFLFVPEKNKLHFETNLPKQALPGDSMAVEMTVKDFKNRARKGVNMTVYAVNKAFAENIQAPFIQVPERYQNRVEIKPLESKGIANLFSQSFNANHLLKNVHFTRFNLRKNEYYQLRHPENEISTIPVKKQFSNPEFALFLTHQNNLISPKYILVDGQPVYISDVNKDEIYSFAIPAGKHRIAFRYFNKLYEMPEQQFSASTKYLFGINIDSIRQKNSWFKITDSLSPVEASPQEKDLLYPTLLLTNTFPSDSVFIQSENLNHRKKYYNGYRMNVMNIDGDNYFVQGPFDKYALITLQRNTKSYPLKTGVETVYHFDEILKEFKAKNMGKIKGAFLPFMERNLTIAQVNQMLQPDTLVPEPQKAELTFKPKTEEALRNKSEDEEYLYQNYRSPGQGNPFYIWIENTCDTQFIKSMWIVSKTRFEVADFVQNVPRQVYTFNKMAAEETYDIYLFLNKNRMKVLRNQHYNAYGHLYLNPRYMRTEAFSKEKIEVPLKIFSELNAVPLLPFYDAPYDAPEKIKKEESSRNNLYIHGMITAEDQQPLEGTLVYLEMNGVFKYGAITNANGLFEILNAIPGSYQVKLYHPSYKVSHYKSMLFEAKSAYLLNASMVAKEISHPVFETIHNDFRLMAFREHEKANTLRMILHEKENRSLLENYQILLYRKGELMRTIASTGMYTDIPFLPEDGEVYSLEIRKTGYTTLRLNNLYFKAHYYLMIGGFLGLEKKEILKLKEYNLNLGMMPSVEKEIVTNSEQVHIYDRGNGSAGEFFGRITDEGGNPLDFASVQVFEGALIRGGAKTDQLGNYKIKPLAPGKYTLKVTFAGYNTQEIQNILLGVDKRVNIDVRMERKSMQQKEVVVKAYKSKLIDASEPGKKSMTISYSSSAPAVSTGDFSAIQGGVYQRKESSESLSISGDRSSSTVYMIDGMMVRGGRDVQLSSVSYNSINSGISEKYRNATPTYADVDMIDRVAQNKNVSTTRKNFSDVGFWKPNMISNKQGKIGFTLKLPDNITTWKTFMLGMGKGWMHGIDSAEIQVYKPIQTIVTVSDYLYKGDQLRSKIKYMNLTKEPLNLLVSGSINGKESFSRNVRVQHTYMDSMEVNALSLDSITYLAGLRYQENYKDYERYQIPVFSPALIFHTNQSLLMEEDSTYELNIKPNTKGQIIFNNNLMEKIMAVVDELNNYEYGCVEQTASKLNAMLSKNYILISMKQTALPSKRINALLGQLADMQNTDGSFGWWKRNGTNDRMTIYAMEIAQKALQAGYLNNIFNSANNYVLTHFKNMSISDKIYAYHVLLNARTNSPETDQLYANIQVDQLTGTDKIYFYQNKRVLGQTVVESDVYAVFLELNKNLSQPYTDNFFYDHRADVFKAYRLFKGSAYESSFIKLFKAKLMNGQLEKNMNTYAKVAMIEALTMAALSDGSKPIQSTLTINDTLVIKEYPTRIPISGSRYKIKHQGGDVFVNTSEEQRSETPDISDSVFSLRTYFLQGTSNSTIGKDALKMGEACQFKIDIQAYKKAEHVMIEIPIPSGMKIKNKETHYSKGYYVQYFKHKVVYYFENLSMGTHQLDISLTPVFAGRYVVAPAKISLMYYPFVYGNTGRKEIEIR